MAWQQEWILQRMKQHGHMEVSIRSRVNQCGMMNDASLIPVLIDSVVRKRSGGRCLDFEIDSQVTAKRACPIEESLNPKI